MAKKESYNNNLHKAKNAKKDEFYTQLHDIENELKHYKEHFAGKTVYCNCDDPRVSNFFHYFSHNFESLGLKKLITTCYKNQNMDLFSQNESEEAVSLVYKGDKNENGVPDPEEIGLNYLKGDGDFRSPEAIELLKEADIVVTNPPFSLFREYVAQLIEYDKKFVILGNINAITYKDCFELIKNNKMWLGNNTVRMFQKPDGTMYETARTFWYTNLEHNKRNEEFVLYKRYKSNEQDYPKYDNYDAIEVSQAVNIPMDFEGAMGVPITFLDKFNPNQFEILGIMNSGEINEGIRYPNTSHGRPIINGKEIYFRILIKNKNVIKN